MTEQFKERQPKFGSMHEAYFHGNCFKKVAVETDYPRVYFATDDGYISLIRQCLEFMPAPFHVMYVLIRNISGNENIGRYYTETQMSRKELNSFLDQFGEFFEGDGRHNIWFISNEPKTFIVYDHHNVMFAYGEQEQFLRLLRSKNYIEKEPDIPNPHYHAYNYDYGIDETDVLNSREWIRYDLEPDDDP